MPIQLWAWERRDNGDRDTLARTALQLCRAIRVTDGISYSRYYWHGPDAVVVLTEGDLTALENPGTGSPVEYARTVFDMADLARLTANWRLGDARAGEEDYRRAGRGDGRPSG